jgi:hypothetical protein
MEMRRILCATLAAAAVGCAATTSQPEPGPVGTTGTISDPEPVSIAGDQNRVPVGQELDVRLQSRLGSETANVEDRFDATTLVDMRQDTDVLIPAGSVVRGVVASVEPATRLDRTGSLTLSFDQITVRGVEYPIRAMATEVFRSEGIEGEAPRIGAGAGVGAIVGGILGGLRGALAGVLIGAGGTIAATEGEDVVLPAGTIIRIRFDSPLQLPLST